MRKLIALSLLLITCNSFAQISEKQVDELVENTLKSFNVPGIAVAIVKDGKVVLSKGYGIKSILTKEKVDANTLFGIASNSKAFTTAALAMLVDEKKLNWDDKVIQYLPDFKMYNEYVTNEFTIRDLVTHRSGLGLGAGDLMIWPDGRDFKATDIIHNLQSLKFRKAARYFVCLLVDNVKILLSQSLYLSLLLKNCINSLLLLKSFNLKESPCPG